MNIRSQRNIDITEQIRERKRKKQRYTDRIERIDLMLESPNLTISRFTDLLSEKNSLRINLRALKQ